MNVAARGVFSRLLTTVLAITLNLCLVGVAAAGIVYVPAPTGVPGTDRSNIEQAIDRADDGDVVQFGVGTYVLGDASEFIAVRTPELRLVGSTEGTTILGGDVPPVPDSVVGAPYLFGNSLQRSPPMGFHLTADEQRISGIRFEGFRTAVMIGFFPFAETGGYAVEDCEFAASMYGIIAHVESSEESVLSNNSFINNTFPYTISGGLFRSSDNYVASPDPARIPVDYTHHAGTLIAGDPNLAFLAEGMARITEHNVFEQNVVDGGVADGYQIISEPGGTVRNNLFRNSDFNEMGDFGTFAVALGLGGDIVDNAFAKNTLNGSEATGLLFWNLGGGKIDGNLVVGNQITSTTGNFWYPGGAVLVGATSSILLNNEIDGIAPGALWNGAGVYFGHSNLVLLNDTDAYYAALFYFSPGGIFASRDAAAVAIDEDYNLVDPLDPLGDFTRLLHCEDHLKDTESTEDFRECVGEAIEELD